MTMLLAAAVVAAGIASHASLQTPQAQPVAATTQPAPEPAGPSVAMAVRTQQPPAIDGRDTDEVWRRAPRIREFRQFDPELDADPSLPTEFQVAYDDANLYVFVRAHDPHPDSIMRALTRRDVRGPPTRSRSSSTPSTTGVRASSSQSTRTV